MRVSTGCTPQHVDHVGVNHSGVDQMRVDHLGVDRKHKLYSDFELQGVTEEILNSKTYQTVTSRLQVEEATMTVTEGRHHDAEDSEGYPEMGLEDDEARKGPKVTVHETPGDDSYVNKLTNATQSVVGRVGNMFGRGFGGITNKIPGSWF
uniref:Uncharacterized protein n=1 Tax=Strigamia maritima TaxID=126957 RepID=T1IRY2_STRMM